MDLIPIWTKQIKLVQKARNPLGLSRISQYITAKLLPGITTLTIRARNFSFYCWAIKQISQYDIKFRKEFYKIISKLETSYVIAGLLDAEKNFQNAKGPIGRIKGKNRINKRPDEEKININFSVLEHPGGGYGQYYKNAMDLLSLTKTKDNRLALTSDGLELSEIFEDNIKNTKYYKEYLQEDEIPINILEEYGQFVSYLRLKENEKERDKICTIFFNKNQSQSIIQDSRKITFLLILELFRIFTENNLNLTDDDFRNITYFGKTEKDGKIISYEANKKGLKNIILQWKFYQLQEYLILTLENLLNIFIESINERNEKGLSKEEFIKNNEDFIVEFEDYCGIKCKDKKLIDIINLILEKIGVEKLYGVEARKLFNKKLNLKSKNSELKLSKIITELSDSKKMKVRISHSILLLIIIMIRYKYLRETFFEELSWIHHDNASDNLSFITILKNIENQLLSSSLLDFFIYVLDKIIEQHNSIAFQKLKYRNNTFRFEYRERTNKYYYKRSYYYERGSNKFNTIREIFEDLGLIEKKKEKYILTTYGKNILEKLKNGS